MREVTADSDAFLVVFGRGSIVARELIAKSDAVVNVVADRLDALPATVDRTEQGPCEIGQFLRVARARPALSVPRGLWKKC